jgi:hypothetical protein
MKTEAWTHMSSKPAHPYVVEKIPAAPVLGDPEPPPAHPDRRPTPSSRQPGDRDGNSGSYSTSYQTGEGLYS